MKWKKPLRWALPAAFLLLCALTLFFFSRYTQSADEALLLTPTLTDARGWTLYTQEGDTPRPLSSEEVAGSSGTIYLSRRLDPAWEAAGYTYLELDATWQFSLFLDGVPFYTTTPGSGDRVGAVSFPAQYPGIPGMGETARCTLPPGYGGKTLTVAAQRACEWPSPPSLHLTRGALVVRDAVALTNRLGMPATAFAVAALFLLAFFAMPSFGASGTGPFCCWLWPPSAKAFTGCGSSICASPSVCPWRSPWPLSSPSFSCCFPWPGW